MTSMKIVQFSRFPTPSPIVQLRPKYFHSFDLGCALSKEPPSPSPNDNHQLKGKIILGWLLYVIRSFLQVGFHFQYQHIDLVWLSMDFFSFSWSQSLPQSSFKKLKISFSSSFYSVKMRWGQDWAEALVSTFSWLYIPVCAVFQKYHEMFF